MSLFFLIFSLLSIPVIVFLTLPFLELLVASQKKKKTYHPLGQSKTDFGIIITAYRTLDIAKPLVDSLLRQKYEDYHIYLVADACGNQRIDLKNKKVDLLRPEEHLNLKIKSIIYAVAHFGRPHDYILVFDADNLAHPIFLSELNKYIQSGFKAVQGQRRAKNLDTLYACADAMGEFYKNYIERYLPFCLGSSAVISGSGMAVFTPLYQAYLNSPEVQFGKRQQRKMLQEDKILQNFLLKQQVRIAYAKTAILYDEKVSTAKAIETQRSRWLYSYFQNTKNALKLIKLGIQNFSFNQFWFGLITLAPPMFIQLFLGLILCVIAWWYWPIYGLILIIAISVFLLNIFLVLYLSKVPRQVWHALWILPSFVFRQFMALFKMTKPQKNFQPTQHKGDLTIEDMTDAGC